MVVFLLVGGCLSLVPSLPFQVGEVVQSRALAPVVAPTVGTAFSITIPPCLVIWMLVASSLWVSWSVCGGRSGVVAGGVGLALFRKMVLTLRYKDGLNI